jgi:hypothetical protein
MKRLFTPLLIALIVSCSAPVQEAHWITVDDETCNERNVWIEFQKDFDLKSNEIGRAT